MKNSHLQFIGWHVDITLWWCKVQHLCGIGKQFGFWNVSPVPCPKEAHHNGLVCKVVLGAIAIENLN